jgi:hypothetical protein
MAPAGNSSVDWQGHVGMVQQADRRYVKFFAGKVQNGVQSIAAGRPIFETVDMLEIRHPGEKEVHHIRVREEHKHEFPRHWAAYEAGRVPDMDGTPIETLYPNDPAMVQQFKHLHIFTAEQMAGMTEQGISRLGMGGRSHVERAQKFLEAAKGMAGAHKMQRELDEANERAEALAEKMALMERQLAALAEAQPKRRGRPPNDSAEETDQ